jgi:hypothetical protein
MVRRVVKLYYNSMHDLVIMQAKYETMHDECMLQRPWTKKGPDLNKSLSNKTKVQ